MKSSRKFFQRFAVLILIAALSCSVAYCETIDNCTVTVTIEQYMRIDIVQEGIVMTSVPFNWFADGNDHVSTGTSGFDVWTNAAAHVWCPNSLVLKSANNQIEVEASISVYGANEAYECAPHGWAINYAPGTHVGHTGITITTGRIPWEAGQQLAGTYSETLTLTLLSGWPGQP